MEFRRTRDRKVRDRLILTYAPLVKYVAGRLGSGLPEHVDDDDLVSYGLLGLIGAIERYDPGRDIKFETYAIARIKGSIIDELRAMDWVPRSVRARVDHLHDVRVVELGDRPGLAAEALGLVGVARHVAVHELHRHLAFEHGVEGAVDGRHTARADLLVQPVPAAQAGPEERAHPAYCGVAPGPPVGR